MSEVKFAGVPSTSGKDAGSVKDTPSSAERKSIEDCSDAVVRREWLETRIENSLPRDKSGLCRDNEAFKDGLRFARVDTDPEARSLAAQLLGKVAALEDAQALPVLVTLLDDAANVVKAAACKALGKVAPKGNVLVGASLIRLATHADCSVAVAAIRSLRKVANRGDKEATAPLLATLQTHSEPAAIAAAARGLQEVGGKGDSAIMAALLHALRTSDSSQARMASAEAAAELAEEGDEQVVDELLARLVDEEEGCLLKDKCAAGLGRVARRGDAAVVAGLVTAVRGGEYEVQIPSIRALASVAPVGDCPTTAVLLELLDDDEVGIRLEAVKALAAVGKRGQQDVVRGVLERLVDRNAAVRTQAVIALGSVAGRQDKEAIGALGRIMDNSKQESNGQMAIEALVRIVRSIEDEDTEDTVR